MQQHWVFATLTAGIAHAKIGVPGEKWAGVWETVKDGVGPVAAGHHLGQAVLQIDPQNFFAVGVAAELVGIIDFDALALAQGDDPHKLVALAQELRLRTFLK